MSESNNFANSIESNNFENSIQVDNDSMPDVESPKRKRELTEDEILLENYNTKRICLESLDFVCPITKQIFVQPVICDDGFAYEKWALDGVFNCGRSKISPMTRKPISKYCESNLLNKSISMFLNENPEFKKLQFDDGVYYNFSDNIINLTSLLNSKDFKMISKYREIHLNYDLPNGILIKQIAINCDDKRYFGKILDNCIDLNTKNENGNLPIYYICKYGTIDIILCAFEKDIDIYNIDKNGNSIMHLLLGQHTKLTNDEKIKAIKCLIYDKNIDFNNKNQEGDSILCKIITTFPYDCILHVLGKNPDFYNIDIDGNSVIHKLLNVNDLEYENKVMIIKYLIEEKNFDLNRKNKQEQSSTYHICKKCSSDMILYILEKGVDLYGINKNKDSIMHVIFNEYNGENKMQLIDTLITNYKWDVSYKNISGTSILSLLIKNDDITPSMIFDMIHDKSYNMAILLEFNVLDDILLYKKYDFLSDLLIKIQGKLKLMSDDELNNLISGIIKNHNNKNAEIMTILYFPLITKFTQYLNDLNDNDHIEPMNKKEIMNILIDIFIMKLDINEIDAKMLISFNSEIKKLQESNRNRLLNEWENKIKNNEDNEKDDIDNKNGMDDKDDDKNGMNENDL